MNTDTKTITVPANYVVYRCKISGGCIIELPLPPEFTKADARKLYAFLKTQDEEGEPQDD